MSIVTTQPASAEAVTASYVIEHSQLEPVQMFLAGMVEGLGSANAGVVVEGQRPLYCAPREIALTANQVLQLMVRHIERKPNHGTLPAGAIMLVSMQENFPCK